MTRVVQVDPFAPQLAVIREAAAVLRSGGLVAFPTETVYGLGANALDAAAVEKIFQAKGRPANNPLIVHFSDPAAAECVVTDWPSEAALLAARFWPGPLTLVLPKADIVPGIVTAGSATVGVRVPANLIALELLAACGFPLAAPSANATNRISPTSADHVRRSLAEGVDLILDGGPTTGGLESTVLDLASGHPRILRLGLVTQEQIEAVIGPVETPRLNLDPSRHALPSPGVTARHYSPRARLEIAVNGANRVRELLAAGARVGWLRLTDVEAGAATSAAPCPCVDLPGDPVHYARGLYSALHRLDEEPIEYIVVDQPPQGSPWAAIHDRLRRASAR